MRSKGLFFLILCFVSISVFAQQKELKVLFAGNSYTYAYNLPFVVSIISEQTPVHIDAYQSTRGGARLEEHWLEKRNLRTKELIDSGDYDIVVLQAHSMSGMNTKEETLRYMGLLTEYIKKHGAEVYLYNTWAREKVPQYQEEIDDMYIQGAEENDAIRVPVGTAWAMAQDLRPMVDLYTSDGSHPNELGCLLTAAMFTRAICGELPEKLPTVYRVPDARGEMIRLMTHNPEDVEFVRRIVNEVYQEQE